MSCPGELVRIDDTSLWVVDRGASDAHPVLVLHGGPGLDHHEFGDYLDPLTDEFRLLLIDLRSQGRSEKAPPQTWTIERMAQDVIMLARAIHLRRYSVLGHSFGAMVALQNAVDYPGGAASTIVSHGVASARWFEEVDREVEKLEPPDVRERVKASIASESSARTQAEFERLNEDQMPFHFANTQDPRIGDYIRRSAETVYAPDVLAAFSSDSYGRIELEDRLSDIPQPTLVLAGRYDRVCPVRASRSMARRIPGAELHVFERSAHMSFVEEQPLYLDVVRTFLRRTA
jgi:proline iminopeptidase